MPERSSRPEHYLLLYYFHYYCSTHKSSKLTYFMTSSPAQYTIASSTWSQGERDGTRQVIEEITPDPGNPTRGDISVSSGTSPHCTVGLAATSNNDDFQAGIVPSSGTETLRSAAHWALTQSTILCDSIVFGRTVENEWVGGAYETDMILGFLSQERKDILKVPVAKMEATRKAIMVSYVASDYQAVIQAFDEDFLISLASLQNLRDEARTTICKAVLDWHDVKSGREPTCSRSGADRLRGWTIDLDAKTWYLPSEFLEISKEHAQYRLATIVNTYEVWQNSEREKQRRSAIFLADLF